MAEFGQLHAKIVIVASMNELKIIIFLLNYLAVLVYIIIIIIHLSVGG